MERMEVYDIIDSERNYQDSKWAGHKHEVGTYLTMIRTYLHEAEENWTRNSGDKLALESIRKIAGIAVSCMEEHGATYRELTTINSGGL